MKIHGTAKGGALSKKDFGVAFGGGVVLDNYPDSLGDDADMTETNATLDTTNEILGSGCVDFNGTDAYADLGGSVGDYSFLTQKFSLSMWLYPTIDHQDVIFDTFNASGANVGFGMRFNTYTGTKTLMVTIATGGDSTGYSSDDVWTDSEWQLVNITYDGTTMKTYRNTTLVGSGSVTSTTSTPSFVPRLAWAADGGDNKMEALVDDFALFADRVLTSGEISSIYNSGSGELISEVFGAGNRAGIKAYYNMDAITGDTIINNANLEE